MIAEILAFLLFCALIVAVYYIDTFRKERDETAARAEKYRKYWQDTERDLAKLDNELEEAISRCLESDRLSAEVVIAVAPLLEKTDWMSGRWAARFDELQQLEQERNKKVDEVRRKVMEIPVVDDLDRESILEGAAIGASQRLANAVGVPEGQNLAFGAEGGVERVSGPVWVQDTLPGMEDESIFRPLEAQ